MSEHRQVSIYALVDPRDNEVRYVGKTVQALEDRLKGHLYGDTNAIKQAWLNELAAAGFTPEIRLLEIVDVADWGEAERRWIATGKERGWKLTNIAKGGGRSLNVWADNLARRYLIGDLMPAFEALSIEEKIDVLRAPTEVGLAAMQEWCRGQSVPRDLNERMAAAATAALEEKAINV